MHPRQLACGLCNHGYLNSYEELGQRIIDARAELQNPRIRRVQQVQVRGVPGEQRRFVYNPYSTTGLVRISSINIRDIVQYGTDKELGDFLERIYVLNCGHSFHQHCLYTDAMAHNSPYGIICITWCPTCEKACHITRDAFQIYPTVMEDIEEEMDFRFLLPEPKGVLSTFWNELARIGRALKLYRMPIFIRTLILASVYKIFVQEQLASHVENTCESFFSIMTRRNRLIETLSVSTSGFSFMVSAWLFGIYELFMLVGMD